MQNTAGLDRKLTPDRMALLTRMYHSSRWAAEATGMHRGCLERAAKRFGLSFRNPGHKLHLDTHT